MTYSIRPSRPPKPGKKQVVNQEKQGRMRIIMCKGQGLACARKKHREGEDIVETGKRVKQKDGVNEMICDDFYKPEGVEIYCPLCGAPAGRMGANTVLGELNECPNCGFMQVITMFTMKEITVNSLFRFAPKIKVRKCILRRKRQRTKKNK